jgi:hypothetical protein
MTPLCQAQSRSSNYYALSSSTAGMTLSESKVRMTGSLAIPSEGGRSMYPNLLAVVRSAESHDPGRVT